MADLLFTDMLTNLNIGYDKGGRVLIQNQEFNLKKQAITLAKFNRAKQLLSEGKTKAETMRIITQEFKLMRSPYAGTTKWLRAAADAVQKEGIEINSGVPEKIGEGSDVRGTKKRRALDRKRSNVKLQQAISGKKTGLHLSHAGFKNSLVGGHNLMYVNGRMNSKMRIPFEDKLFASMTKFSKVYNNPKAPDKVKRLAAVEYAKKDRALRKKFPEYAKFKTRLSFKNSAFSPGFIVKEKLIDPSMAISNEPGMLLKGESPKSPKGKEIIKKAQEALKKSLKITGKVIKPLGVVTGAMAVNTALKAGEKNPFDLVGSYLTGDAETATTNRRIRQEPEFRKKYMSELPQIQPEGFELMEEEDFTSYFNGGIVAVKGVK